MAERKPPQDGELDDAQATSLARRRLLKLTCYAVPILLGTFTVRSAAAASCTPSCNPNGGSCGPSECRPNT